MAWTSDELDRIGRVAELHITTHRRDGTLRRWIPIWVVRVSDGLYVRSAFGTAGSWYRFATRNNTARIRADGVEANVRLVAANDAATNADVDAAYRSKYRGQGSALDTMVAAAAAQTTLQLVDAAA